jgi:hypothetical protein
MHKSASPRSVRSGYWKARFGNAGRRPLCLSYSSRDYEKNRKGPVVRRAFGDFRF